MRCQGMRRRISITATARPGTPPATAGTLQAAFDGTQGWFWRNRTNGEATVTLKTSGDYQQIKRVL